jgi:AcrR family transcriptional regulator
MAAKRTPLTRSDILVAALRIVDEQGADALSMRRLARDLGIEAMSLYHHFPNKEAILDGVIELAMQAEAPAGAPPAPSWREPVAASVLGFRRVLVKHPNVLPVMVAHPPTSTGTSIYVEGPLRYLSAHGFTDDAAAELFQGLFALAFGHAMLSTSYGSLELEGVPTVTFDEAGFARTLDVLLRGYDDAAGVTGP